MPLRTRLFIEVERRASAGLARLVHRRHQHALDRGAVDEATARVARLSWWGDDPRWYPGSTPPRRHNQLTPLIDGEAYFAALHAALSNATRYAYVVDWSFTPFLPLRRERPEELVTTRLLDILGATARRVPVRVLLWSGAPAVLKPTTQEVEGVARLIEDLPGDIICRLDTTAGLTHSHHQKAVVVDGRLAFVGGIDLTTLGGDRWDCPGHPLRAGENWHDAAFLAQGEVVGDVEQNFRQRWEAVTGERLPASVPPVEPSWQTPAQVVRTIHHDRYPFVPDGEYGIHHAYMAAIHAARRFVYLESQYLWSPEILDALARLIRTRDPESFRIVIVLPARATSGKWDNDQHVQRLRRIDAGRGIFEAYSLYASGPAGGKTAFRYRPIYVHAKIGIIDDEWLTIGSANLNNRGMITDTEMNIVATDRELARSLRVDLWSEHLNLPRAEVERAEPRDLIDGAWKTRAESSARIIKQGHRPLEASVHRYQRGLVPEELVLDELQAATFEH